jgi:hypothetical protein
MAKYHGQRGRVYLSTSGAGTAVQAVALSSWSLDMPTDRVEVTAFEDTNKVYVQGKKDISGEFSGFWDDTDDALFDAADSTTPVKLYLYPSADAATRYFYGTAWVDSSIEVGVDGAVTVSGSFQAATAWGRMP